MNNLMAVELVPNNDDMTYSLCSPAFGPHLFVLFLLIGESNPPVACIVNRCAGVIVFLRILKLDLSVAFPGYR